MFKKHLWTLFNERNGILIMKNNKSTFFKTVISFATAVLLLTMFNISKPSPSNANEQFMFGIEALMNSQKSLLENKQVGLVTNPTGVDQNLNSTIDILYNDPDINLTALYGPEHGVRGNEQAGAYVESYTDPDTGLPVYSLYGQTRKPSPEMLEDVDVLLFDIQDAGVTYYTYVWTMYYVMEAAAENDVEVVILDRPNPLGGDLVDGPVTVEEGQSSFVGLKDLALIHGMTFGEIAHYFNEEFELNANVEVVKMNNYDRSKRYEELGVPFVLPSPNIPTTDTIQVYPITGFYETFSNVSEGRGTTKPFELVGAEFVNSTEYARALNDLELPGVRFRAAAFTPAPGQKLAGTLVQGVEVYVMNPDIYNPIHTGLSMMKVLNEQYPGQVDWRNDQWLARLTGKTYIEEDIRAGVSVDEIVEKWQPELEEFKAVRKNYLLYGPDANSGKENTTEAESTEPVFVDEIVVSLKRGNGKLRNPKTYIQNMNQMPGGFDIEVLNKNELDLSGEQPEGQFVEMQITYSDSSSETFEVPLVIVEN